MIIGATTNRLESASEYDFNAEDMKEYSRQVASLVPWMLKYLKNGKRPHFFVLENWFDSIKNNNSILPITHNCGAAVSIIAVTPDGFFYPCAKFSGLHNWCVGNVNDGIDVKKVKKIWIDFIKAISSHCGICWAYPICHGPCIWECARNDGTIVFDDKYCFFVKKAIEASAYLVLKTEKHEEGSK